MPISKDELLYYLVIGFVGIVIEIANQYGAGICVFPPLMLLVYWAVLKYVPKEETPSA